MVAMRIAVVLLCLAGLSRSDRVKLEAKKLINGKVVANGHSVVAKSLSQCMEHCSERENTCDGVVFHKIIGKCRLINKCAPAFQVDNTSSIAYYSVRPQIKSHGYVHDSRTDSCLGLVFSRVDYPSAEALCTKQNANLAILSDKYLNNIGKDLLSKSDSDWAWIKHENVAYPNKSKAHGVSGNDVLPEEVFSPEVVQRRSDSVRSCWGLNKFGQWGQFPCKNATLIALCQVHRFNH